MYVVVLVGFVISVGLLAIAIKRGRQPPVHRVPWIIAIVVLSIDVAFHAIVSIAGALAGGWEGAWLVIGTLAIAGVLAMAALQPRIAGWWFIASAGIMPAVLATTDAVNAHEEQVPVTVMLAFYSSRALIVGGLLVWSARARLRNT